MSWNARPALVAALCFAAGVAVSEWLDPPLVAWLATAGAGLLAAAAGYRAERIVGLNDLLLTVGALVLLAACGGLRQLVATTPATDHVVHAGFGMEVEVRGWIIDDPRVTGESTRFVMKLDPAESTHSGLLMVSVRRAAVVVRTCDVVRLRGELAELPRRRNPGDFDYGSYLRRQQIYARLFADEAVRVGGRRFGMRRSRRTACGRRTHRPLPVGSAGACRAAHTASG